MEFILNTIFLINEMTPFFSDLNQNIKVQSLYQIKYITIFKCNNYIKSNISLIIQSAYLCIEIKYRVC